MPPARRPFLRQQRGSGWFEFALAAALISFLALFLIHGLMEYQALAERAVLDLTIRNMRSGLRWQVAERLMRQRSGELAGLAGTNPVAWLMQPPQGYLGEFGAFDAAPDAGGIWYFDRARRQLAYVPRQPWIAGPMRGSNSERRWQVQTLKSTAAPAVSAPVTSVVLVELVPPRRPGAVQPDK